MAKARHSRFDCHPGCSVEAAITLIDGKWKCVVLFHLMEQALRFSEIHRAIPAVSQRILTKQLRELEADGLIHRRVFAQVPPRVEYSMTKLGLSLAPILKSLKTWGDTNMHRFGSRERAKSKADR